MTLVALEGELVSFYDVNKMISCTIRWARMDHLLQGSQLVIFKKSLIFTIYLLFVTLYIYSHQSFKLAHKFL